MHTYIHTYIQTHAYIYIHIHTHTFIYAYACSNLQKLVELEDNKKTGFDSWLSNLKLITVDELIQKDVVNAIKNNAYELQIQQTDHVYPDIDKKVCVYVGVHVCMCVCMYY